MPNSTHSRKAKRSVGKSGARTRRRTVETAIVLEPLDRLTKKEDQQAYLVLLWRRVLRLLAGDR